MYKLYLIFRRVLNTLFVLFKGVGITEAIYKSKWYDADNFARKYVLIIMTRAQVPINFTANGFAVISRSTIVFLSKFFQIVLILREETAANELILIWPIFCRFYKQHVRTTLFFEL